MVYVKRSDGSGASKLIVQEPPPDKSHPARPGALAPQLELDGKDLLYIRQEGPTGSTIVSIPASGVGQERLVVAPGSAQSNIIDFRLSPNGRWLAYTSNESGHLQVCLVAYPNSKAGKWQVSTSGGQSVTWRADSDEIFYWNNIDEARLYAVPFNGQDAQPRIGAPRPLFSIPSTAFNGYYDVMPIW
jgi:hypothetical protein